MYSDITLLPTMQAGTLTPDGEADIAAANRETGWLTFGSAPNQNLELTFSLTGNPDLWDAFTEFYLVSMDSYTTSDSLTDQTITVSGLVQGNNLAWDFRSFNDEYSLLGDARYGLLSASSRTIPEPSTWLLLSLGVAGMTLFRRRRVQ